MFVNRCTKLKVQKAAIFQYTSLSLQTVPPLSQKNDAGKLLQNKTQRKGYVHGNRCTRS